VSGARGERIQKKTTTTRREWEPEPKRPVALQKKKKGEILEKKKAVCRSKKGGATSETRNTRTFRKPEKNVLEKRAREGKSPASLSSRTRGVDSKINSIAIRLLRRSRLSSKKRKSKETPAKLRKLCREHVYQRISKIRREASKRRTFASQLRGKSSIYTGGGHQEIEREGEKRRDRLGRKPTGKNLPKGNRQERK